MKKFMKSAVALFLACLLLIPGGFVFAAEPVDFADVDADDWFAPYVDYCSKYGLVNGMTATTFEPNTSLSRAMFVTILCRSVKAEPSADATIPFTDVAESHWAKDAILWAYENEIVNGMTPTTFQPDGKITREQMCTILCRFADAMGYDIIPYADGNVFADDDMISEWAYDSVYACYEGEIVNGITEDSFGPKQNATRAQACTILQRFFRNVTTTYTETEGEDGKVLFEYADKFGVYATGYTVYSENGDILEDYYEEEGYWYKEVITYNEDGTPSRRRYDDSDGYWDEDTYTYNEKGDILTQRCDAADDYWYTYAYTYDENGNLVKVRYDVCHGYWYEESYTYDESGNTVVEKYEDSDGYVETTTYTYDEAGNLTECKLTDSDGYEQTETYTYNEAGKITKYLRLDSDGGETLWQYTYDDDGLLERITQYNGEGGVEGDFTHSEYHFVYEDVAGEKKVGLFLVNSGDETLAISQVYSEEGYLKEVIISVDTVISFRFDGEGNVTYIKYDTGDIILESVDGSFNDGMPDKLVMDIGGLTVNADINWETMEITMTDGEVTETDDSGDIPLLVSALVMTAEQYEEITLSDIDELADSLWGLITI